MDEGEKSLKTFQLTAKKNCLKHFGTGMKKTNHGFILLNHTLYMQ